MASESTPRRELAGINNAMPTLGGGEARGYVILGPHASWASAPVNITIAGEEFSVQKETHDYMVRGLALSDGTTTEVEGGPPMLPSQVRLDADVTCEDGSSIACVINVETVC